MSNTLRPEEPEQLACEVCLGQIPTDTAVSAEGDDYVLHFCGIACYRQWREQDRGTEPGD